jgi:hypothetical protein
MRSQLTFSTFDPLFSDAPRICEMCGTRPSVFRFEDGCNEGDSTCQRVAGFCCSSCATRLLEELQQKESATWAEEEASVRKEGDDVTDFHKRRLATFGACGRS